MAEFFAELKRRHIYRVGAAYVVIAWALAQGIGLLSQIFDLSGSITQPAIVLLVVGFPVALVAAWMIESKPHQAVASAVRSKPTVVDWTLCGALAVVLLFMGYQQIAPSSVVTTTPPSADAAKGAASISLAVFPFENLSGDPNQEYFSDGITEEITAALAKVPDLRVVARTSAKQYMEQNRDIQSIGQQLHATHFIEGSVRREGNRLRITAQLIEAANGVHIWAESFDRELTGVFAIQEEIATAIAGALRVPLGLRPGAQLVADRAIDPESYAQYLRAKAVGRQGAGVGREVSAILEPLLARHPDYAPAWALLARFYANANDPKTESAASRAMQLDPNSPEVNWAHAVISANSKRFARAEDFYSKALAVDPNHSDILHAYSNWLAMWGRVKASVSMKQQLYALEPFVPVFNGNFAAALWLDGQNDAAIDLVSNSDRAGERRDLAEIYASAGRYGEAADIVAALPQYPAELKAEAARLLRTAPASVSSPQSLPRLGQLKFVYLYIGAPERALEFYEETVKDRLNGGQAMLLASVWHPSYASVRKTERFKTLVRDAGLVDYWRARGWPDMCRPVGADDFICD